MKTTQKRMVPESRGIPPKDAAGETRGRQTRPVAATVRQWASEKVQKSAVDTAEGGSGQP